MDWHTLDAQDMALWLTIGLARFAGLRRDEIANCRIGWIEKLNGAVSVSLRDRPEEKFWTKTGKPYRALVINSELANYLSAIADFGDPVGWIVPIPAVERARWFERTPQAWLRKHGVTSQKPLHRLRGLYADAVAELTRDSVAARLAGIKAAQDALGHTSSAVTESHYLTPDSPFRG